MTNKERRINRIKKRLMWLDHIWFRGSRKRMTLKYNTFCKHMLGLI